MKNDINTYFKNRLDTDIECQSKIHLINHSAPYLPAQFEQKQKEAESVPGSNVTMEDEDASFPPKKVSYTILEI